MGVLSDGHGLSVCRGGSDPKTREGRECRLSGAGVEGGSHLITLRPPPPLTQVGKDRKDAGGVPWSDWPRLRSGRCSRHSPAHAPVPSGAGHAGNCSGASDWAG